MSKQKLRSYDHSCTQFRMKGKFAHVCGCINHDVWSSSSIYRVHDIVKSKLFKVSVITEMREKMLLSARVKLLCTAYYEYFQGCVFENFIYLIAKLFCFSNCTYMLWYMHVI